MVLSWPWVSEGARGYLEEFLGTGGHVADDEGAAERVDEVLLVEVEARAVGVGSCGGWGDLERFEL